MTDEAISKAKSAFENVTEEQVTLTLSYIVGSGKEFQQNFGKLWEKAQRELLSKKVGRETFYYKPIEETEELCDVCHIRPATIKETKIMPLDASPRPERLCDFCWKLRNEGRQILRQREGKPIELDYIKDENLSLIHI